MYITIRVLTIIILICLVIAPVRARVQEARGSVTGRVTIDGKPAPGIVILLSRHESSQERMIEQALQGATGPKAVTDEDGIFRFDDVPAGRYEVTPFAPALITSSESKSDDDTDRIIVSEGKTTENVNFALSRGGVITGRVTDAEGRPVIREMISLSGADDSEAARPWRSENSTMMRTDDRGVYRLYGLPPGRYTVSAGAVAQGIEAFAGQRNTPRTYHPNVTDKARAKVVEVTSGGEAAGIDIKLSAVAKGLYASGRIVDVAGKPVSNVVMTYMSTQPGAVPTPGGLTASTAKGEFRFENVQPGQYRIFANMTVEETEFYAEPVEFRVENEDVSGIEIKLRRGSTISGIVTFEGAGDQDVASKLTQIMLGASVTGSEPGAFGFGRGKISSDLSFRISGLRPGNATITTYDMLSRSEIKLLRIEREGVEIKNFLEIREGENITGVKLVFAIARGVIRGKVITSGGKLPDGGEIEVRIFHSSTGERVMSFLHDDIYVDPEGNFVIEGLAPGSYDIEVSARQEDASGDLSKLATAKQTVIVTNDAPVEVSITLEIKK